MDSTEPSDDSLSKVENDRFSHKIIFAASHEIKNITSAMVSVKNRAGLMLYDKKVHARARILVVLAFMLLMSFIQSYSLSWMTTMKNPNGNFSQRPFWVVYSIFLSYPLVYPFTEVLQKSVHNSILFIMNRRRKAAGGETLQVKTFEPKLGEVVKLWKIAILAGIVFSYLYVWYLSLKYTSVSVNMTLSNSGAVFTAIFCFLFLGQSRTVTEIIAILGIVAGACVVTAVGSQAAQKGEKADSVESNAVQTTPLGAFLVFLASFLSSFYGVLMPMWVKERHMGIYIAKIGLSNVVLFWPLLVVFDIINYEKWAFPIDYYGVSINFLGAFSSGLAHFSYIWALKEAGPLPTNLACTFMVVISTAVDRIFKGVVLTWPQIIGGVMIISGTLVYATAKYLESTVMLKSLKNAAYITAEKVMHRKKYTESSSQTGEIEQCTDDVLDPEVKSSDSVGATPYEQNVSANDALETNAEVRSLEK